MNYELILFSDTIVSMNLIMINFINIPIQYSNLV
ncbi:unnamed protein product [Arabidopsis halleri]